MIHRFFHFLFFVAFILTTTACNSQIASGGHNSEKEFVSLERLKADIERYVDGKDARIGVAVIINGHDTVEVNGHKDFPMQSVYKFPQALAVADFCERTDLSLSDSISISECEIKENTWSPLRECYGVRNLSLPLYEILEYSLQQSDNNACDILFRLIGGPETAYGYIKSIGFDNIMIVSTEAEMHSNPDMCSQNRTTPLDMARLFDFFYGSGLCKRNEQFKSVAEIMMHCTTGTDRLPAPFRNTKVILSHKTGTGDIDSQGRITAINDAGYIIISDRLRYAIAVFIADSGLDISSTEALIGDISAIVLRNLTGNTTQKEKS